MATTRGHNKVFLSFIDYCKAFDSGNHARMWNVLRLMGRLKHLIILLRELYSEQEATLKTESEEAE